MKILIHVCCAACFAKPHKKLLEEGHEMGYFFYNPNVQPFEEYRRRFRAMQEYAKQKKLDVIFKDEYPLREFLRGAMQAEKSSKKRCEYCYRLRFSETAEKTKELGCDAFTSTLLVSKHQDHELVKRIGEEVAKEHGTKFYYEDFRPLCEESLQEIKDLNLYTQKYCGCVFSEEERFGKELTRLC